MLPYIVTLLVYLLSPQLVSLFSNSLLIKLVTQLILTGASLVYFRESFKFKLKFDFLAIVIGAVIFFLWVFLDPFYPHLVQASIIPYSLLEIVPKLIISIIYAPIIEEFFTRFFLIRWLVDKEWKKVPLGKYTLTSFIITVLFFGFSHGRWLPGLITAILLNLLLYKRRNIESCITTHVVANLLLAIFIIATGSWIFWG